MEEIAQLLQKTTFRKKFLGGVDEADVWKKLQRLQAEYALLIDIERAKADGKISERDQIIQEKERRIAELEATKAKKGDDHA